MTLINSSHINISASSSIINVIPQYGESFREPYMPEHKEIIEFPDNDREFEEYRREFIEDTREFVEETREKICSCVYKDLGNSTVNGTDFINITTISTEAPAVEGLRDEVASQWSPKHIECDSVYRLSPGMSSLLEKQQIPLSFFTVEENKYVCVGQGPRHKEIEFSKSTTNGGYGPYYDDNNQAYMVFPGYMPFSSYFDACTGNGTLVEGYLDTTGHLRSFYARRVPNSTVMLRGRLAGQFSVFVCYADDYVYKDRISCRKLLSYAAIFRAINYGVCIENPKVGDNICGVPLEIYEEDNVPEEPRVPNNSSFLRECASAVNEINKKVEEGIYFNATLKEGICFDTYNFVESVITHISTSVSAGAIIGFIIGSCRSRVISYLCRNRNER